MPGMVKPPTLPQFLTLALYVFAPLPLAPPFPNQDLCSSGMHPWSPRSVLPKLPLLSGKQRVTEEPPGVWEGRMQQGPGFLPGGHGPHSHTGWATTSKP